MPYWQWSLIPFFLLCLSGLTLWVNEQNQTPVAVAIVESLDMRSGDGEEFETISKLESATGREFRFLGKRGDWVKIEAAEHQSTGWVIADNVELVGAN